MFVITRDDLLKVKEEERGDLHIDYSKKLKRKVNRYSEMLEQVNVIGKALQKNHSLAQGLEDLDDRLHAISEMNDDKKAIIYRWNVDGKYISERPPTVHNPDFESDVVKIQNNNKDQLTRSEELTVKNLKRSQAAKSNINENSILS